MQNDNTSNMRKYLITHLAFLLAFFLLITLLKHWFSLIYLYFWAGGMVGLAFSLHLFIDQVIDFMDKRDIGIWFKDLPIIMAQQKIRIYMITNILLLCFLGFFL